MTTSRDEVVRCTESSRPVIVNGTVAPGFESVRGAFQENFDSRGELGAAFAAYRGEEVLVDLWGGVADRTALRPWRADTLQPIFSGAKGLVAICLLMLIERSLLDLDDPVSRYWPDFKKPEIRVRDVVCHRCRLPGIEPSVSYEEFLDGEHMAQLLAVQSPSTDERALLCYHPFTYGWLCGEILRRVDGRSVGRFFSDEVATPLKLEVWIGLPESEEPRVATMELADSWPIAPHLDPGRWDSFLRSVWGNPPVLLRSDFPWNRPDCHAAEIPGGGAIATARSMAALYAGLDRVLNRQTLALARTALADGQDETLREHLRFGVGFRLWTPSGSLGCAPDAFGHAGAGGSVHGCWPAAGVGFSYAMNLMRDDEAVDARGSALLDALHAALGPAAGPEDRAHAEGIALKCPRAERRARELR